MSVGKYGATEVDFVAQKQGVITYYQVAASMHDGRGNPRIGKAAVAEHS